jgi:hypothetical protein
MAEYDMLFKIDEAGKKLDMDVYSRKFAMNLYHKHSNKFIGKRPSSIAAASLYLAGVASSINVGSNSKRSLRQVADAFNVKEPTISKHYPKLMRLEGIKIKISRNSTPIILNKAHMRLQKMLASGKDKFLLVYTRTVNGKRVMNKRNVAITAAVMAAAATGAYTVHRHKKHGVIFRRKIRRHKNG